jgi:hypothetical protein
MAAPDRATPPPEPPNGLYSVQPWPAKAKYTDSRVVSTRLTVTAGATRKWPWRSLRLRFTKVTPPAVDDTSKEMAAAQQPSVSPSTAALATAALGGTTEVVSLRKHTFWSSSITCTDIVLAHALTFIQTALCSREWCLSRGCRLSFLCLTARIAVHTRCRPCTR